MRKRRRLADKLTIMVCAVLVAVSAFFYAPMDVSAEEIVTLPDDVLTGSYDVSINSVLYSTGGFNRSNFDIGFFDFSSYLEDDVVYCVDLTTDVVFNTSVFGQFGVSTMHLGGISGNVFRSFNANGVGNPYILTPIGNSVFYAKGSDLKKVIGFRMVFFSGASTDNFSFDFSFDYVLNSISALTGKESESYQQGYNAGYSVGEQAGEDIGYSNGYDVGFEQGQNQGYESGFEAGKNSVDTDSYYDMGYSAGYDAGYLSGYKEGYDEGYSTALKAVQGSASEQKSSIILDYLGGVECLGNSFYVSSYGLIDMEEYQSGVNGYFYNTVPGTYNGITTASYNIPFWKLNNNSYPKIEGDTLRVRFTLMSLFASLVPDSGSASLDANLMSSKIREVYVTYKGKKYYGNYSTSTSYADFDFVIDDFLGSGPHTLIDGDMTISFVLENSVTIVTNSDITHYVSARYTPKVNFDLGRSNTGNSISLIPYVTNDRVSANIQNQTDQLTGGYNDSQGNSVNSDFSSGLNDFETAEDSLFVTATTGMKDFTFFDISSVPAMVTGMSFVGSIMSGWFTQAGGASGVGIVLSILFSIMLVAMVLGLYRWYQSKGGKD